MTQLKSIRKRKLKISKGRAHKVIKDFCESTSLHGYSYLYIADSIISKLVWTLVILFMSGLGMFLFVKNTNDYIKARLVTNVESSYANLSVRIFFFISNLVIHMYIFSKFFPACGVSICNSLQFESINSYVHEEILCTKKH